MAAAGMTPAQVIVASTKNSAEVLLLSDTGTLQAGKRADFIVLTRTRWRTSRITRKISAGVLNGAAVDSCRAPGPALRGGNR